MDITPGGQHTGRRIIVTDDNTRKLATVTETLRDAGYCVFAAYDRASALELVALLPSVDLLVTNTRLGTLDGHELIRRTREVRPDIAILHILHNGNEEDPGPVDVLHLREPYTPERLLTAVKALLP